METATVTIAGATYLPETLATMTRDDLRRMCREKLPEHPGGSSKINFLSRAALERALINGSWDGIGVAEIEHEQAAHADPLQSAIDALRQLQKQSKNAGIDDGAVKRIVAAELAALQLPRPVSITVPERPAVTIDNPHPALESVVKMLAVGLPVFLSGPTGSGKTHLAHDAARALSLQYYCVSVCRQTTAQRLEGYMDANGQYVTTLFRKAYEHGGVFLLDEVDAGSENVLLVLNSAISNGCMAFPDGMITKHADFRLLAAANTWGQGATRKYIGRNSLDTAFMARWAFVEVGYAESVESALVARKDWLATVRKIRSAALEQGLEVIASPRQSIYGDRLLAAGLSMAETLDAVILAPLGADMQSKIRQIVGA